jgi:predicted RNA methylase
MHTLTHDYMVGSVVQVTLGTVYSLHKRAARTHIKQFASSQTLVAEAAVIAELRYDLPATYKHHKCAAASTLPG